MVSGATVGETDNRHSNTGPLISHATAKNAHRSRGILELPSVVWVGRGLTVTSLVGSVVGD